MTAGYYLFGLVTRALHIGTPSKPQRVRRGENKISIARGSRRARALCLTFTIVSGATLTIPVARTLTVTGNAAVAGLLDSSGTFSFGTFTSTSGTVSFSSTGAQTIPALNYFR